MNIFETPDQESDSTSPKTAAASPEDSRPRKRGLGRGLSALFDDEESEDVAGQGESGNSGSGGGTGRKLLEIAHIQPNPAQPRQHFDPDALEELAASIRQHGIIQPLLVRPREGFPGTYQIVAGERRWRAAQKAQLHEVPVVIRTLSDSQVLEIALIENLQRADLNPIEEAEGYRRLIDQFGHTQEKLADIIGKSRSHVTNMMRLLSLPRSVQTMVSGGTLSAGHARALITAPDPESLAHKIVSEGLSVRQTEAMMAGVSGRPTPPSARKSMASQPKDSDTRALETEISGVLGLPVSIDMKDRQSGALTISFDSLDQLDDILHRLSHFPGARLTG